MLDHNFTCDKCSSETNYGWPVFKGYTCGICLEAEGSEWWEQVKEAAATAMDDGPENYDLSEFNRLAYRIAVQNLRHKVFIEVARISSGGLFLNPQDLSMEIKERIINEAPERFSTVRENQLGRMFVSGQFRIIGGTIPKSELLEIATRAVT